MTPDPTTKENAMSDAVVQWIKQIVPGYPTPLHYSGVSRGRLEREIFGSTPFADVPKSPYYSPAPGDNVRAWLDDDLRHVVVAHDCVETREVHLLPWPTWQQTNTPMLGGVAPSYSCGDCGLHRFLLVAWEQTEVA